MSEEEIQQQRRARILSEYRAAVADTNNEIEIVNYSRGQEGARVTFHIRFGYGVIPPNDGIEDD